jgi:hypothetical protein
MPPLGHAALVANGEQDLQLPQLQSLSDLVDRADGAFPKKL